jgi:hypothetical protein
MKNTTFLRAFNCKVIAMKMHISIITKVILYQVFFLVFHYLYDWFPVGFSYFLGATTESLFQHMKAGFYAYFFLAVIEYGLTHQAISSKTHYLYARLFGASILPLLMLTYFLAGPVIFVKIENIPLEILFANLVLVATSGSTFLLEGLIEKSELSRGLKWMIGFLFTLTAIQYIIFTYRTPWFDVFAVPPGW